jgi:hypothetical protein
LLAALAAVTSIDTGSTSDAITRAFGHSARAANARSPVPVPTSTMSAKLAPAAFSWSSAIRQPVVVS